MTRRPWQTRLVFGSLVALVALVAVLGTWQVVAARDSQRNQLSRGELSEARLASSALRSAIQSRLEQVGNLTQLPQVALLFTPGHAKGLSKVVGALHTLYPEFASFVAIGATGKLEARWPADRAVIGKDLSNNSFFTIPMRSKRSSVSAALQQTSAPHRLVVGMSLPIKDKSGAVVGVLLATLPTHALGSLIGGTSLADGGGVVVVDQAGHLLTGARATAAKSFANLPFVAKALAGKTGAGTGLVPGLSGQRLVAYSPVKPYGWAVVVEEPTAVLDGPISSLTGRLVAIGLIVLFLALGTALLVATLLRRLAREHSRSGAVLTSVGAGVATLDTGGRLSRVNPALEDLVGCAPGELDGRAWSEAVPIVDRSGMPTPWERSVVVEAIEERRVVSTSGYNLHIARSDGRLTPVALSAAPLLVEGNLEGAVVVLRDVTREEEVDQLKSSLVSTVSHELRTPLTMIQGFSELLLTRDDLGATQSREALDQILSSAQRLGRLIDDLLSVSRIESGKLRAELTDVSLGGLLSEVAGVFRATHARSIVLDVDPELPLVRADRDQLVQIVTNLLSNAVKYSGDGAPIEVRARAGGARVEVSVTDGGIGMSEAEVEHIFEQFTRVDHPEVRKAGGTGLGLYITKRLIELQGGELWVTSTPGVGSTFSFSLASSELVEPHPDPRGEQLAHIADR